MNESMWEILKRCLLVQGIDFARVEGLTGESTLSPVWEDFE